MPGVLSSTYLGIRVDIDSALGRDKLVNSITKLCSRLSLLTEEVLGEVSTVVHSQCTYLSASVPAKIRAKPLLSRFIIEFEDSLTTYMTGL